ncbi:porin [Fulvivirga ligni]|uniref:porin n=1 Tax=Fulvivirga ligni TaxID=2904246 RepID=UPI001F300382|nr:porin [Fulvivirga ligni]UII23220.1 porin [Fulvivirga ligni]
MKKYYLLLMIATFLGTVEVNAQDDEVEESKPALSISGSVDAYYRLNFSARNKVDDNFGYAAPGTSFANLPGFALGMANIVTSYEGEKAGFVADLVFGPRGEDAVFGSPLYNAGRGSSQIVNQLYAYWNVSDAVTLTLGNFNTYLGYEVISPASNFNYSTSYMFSYGPFSHTGLKADFAFSDDVSAMLAIMNPTDMTELNVTGTYTLGAQIGFGGAYLNFLYGDQDGKLDEDFDGPGENSAGTTFQVDLTGGWDLSDAVYLGVNATYNTTSAGEAIDALGQLEDADGDGSGFYGVAGYFQVAASEAFSVGARVEYFKMFNGGLIDGSGAAPIGYDADGDGSVIDLTLSANYKVGNLTIIPEFRLDSTSEDYFYDKDYEASKSLSSFVLAAVYSF